MKVAINGFGRIGRTFYRAAQDNPSIEIVAANDLGDEKTLKHLLKYDSTYGIFNQSPKMKFLAEKEPQKLPWKEMGIDVVIESTGRFTDRKGAALHLEAGAKKVVISAPSDDPDVTIILGVNEDWYDKSKHEVISMGSCTTNCLAPIVKILQDEYGIQKGMMTTIHSYTQDQNLQDGPHKDLRRARAAAENIVPTSTGAAKAIFKVIKGLEGKLDGMAIRVPTPTVSVTDLVCLIEKPITEEKLNQQFRVYAQGQMKGILEVIDQPVVSSDLKANPHSSIIDTLLTRVIDGNLVKIVSWYDNEWGYACRLVDICQFLGHNGK
jgi:glyceraldehyde 3-phosphate dehydrogenase